jgi:pilus assembly protein CpaE
MVAEISSSHRAAVIFQQIARQMTGRTEPRKPRGAWLAPIIRKLGRKKPVAADSFRSQM